MAGAAINRGCSVMHIVMVIRVFEVFTRNWPGRTGLRNTGSCVQKHCYVIPSLKRKVYGKEELFVGITVFDVFVQRCLE